VNDVLPFVIIDSDIACVIIFFDTNEHLACIIYHLEFFCLQQGWHLVPVIKGCKNQKAASYEYGAENIAVKTELFFHFLETMFEE
jgi:hypothetical protein